MFSRQNQSHSLLQAPGKPFKMQRGKGMGWCTFCVAGRWKPCSDAHQECWLLERQTAPPQKQGWPAMRGYGKLSVPERHSQVWCCWVGRYPGQAARGMGAMGNPWGARQGLGIPVEAQPLVSFSASLFLYPCHSPVLAQKIWTVSNGAEKI